MEAPETNLVALSTFSYNEESTIFIISAADGTCRIGFFPERNLLKFIFGCIRVYSVTHVIISDSISNPFSIIRTQFPSISFVAQPASNFTKSAAQDAINDTEFLVPQDEQAENRASLIKTLKSFGVSSALAALGGCLIYVKSVMENFKINLIQHIDTPQGLYLPQQAYEDLSIFTSFPNTNSSKISSLFDLLNNCRTQMGTTTLRQWFYMTTSDFEIVQKRLDAISIILDPNNQHKITQASNKIKRLGNMKHALIKLSNGVIHKRIWSFIYYNLNKALDLLHFIKINLVLFNSIVPFDTSISPIIENLVLLIDTEIDLNSDKRLIKDTVSSEVANARKEYEELPDFLSQKATEILNSFPDDSPWKAVSVEFYPEFGFLVCFPKSLKITKENLPEGYKYSHETESTIFTKSDEMRALDESKGDPRQRLIEAETKVATQVAGEVFKQGATLVHFYDTVGELDAIISLAVSASKLKLTKPVFSDGEFRIKQGRHPLLSAGNTDCVPNSTRFEQKIHLITGPNSSGKTLYMKQVALITFMAHIGSFVPAEEAVIPKLDCIYTSFHTNDYAYDAYSSSFMKEISVVEKAIGRCTENSLLLFDEFGRTTNPNDGGALMCALIDYFGTAKQPFLMLSTHLGHLLKKPFIQVDFELFRMEAKLNKESGEMAFSYILKKVEGETDECSYASVVAKMFGVPSKVVERAEEIQKQLWEKKEIEMDMDMKEEEMVARKAVLPFLSMQKDANKRELVKEVADCYLTGLEKEP